MEARLGNFQDMHILLRMAKDFAMVSTYSKGYQHQLVEGNKAGSMFQPDLNFGHQGKDHNDRLGMRKFETLLQEGQELERTLKILHSSSKSKSRLSWTVKSLNYVSLDDCSVF